MLRRSPLATLTLLGALSALPATARAQGVAPRPVPAGLEAAAVPLDPEPAFAGDHPAVARKVIASTRPLPPPTPAPVPLPDDGLAPGSAPARPPVPAPGGLRSAVYRTDVDAGAVVPAGGTAPAPGPVRTAGARLELHVEGPPQVGPGGAYAYVIRVQSTGAAPAAAVRVTDRLPPGAKLTGAEPKPEVAGDRLAWDLGDLPPGAERLVKVNVVAEAAGGEFRVSPSASFGVAPGLKAAFARPPLELRLTGPESAPPGVVMPFRVQVVNNGTVPLPHVLVQVRLSQGLHTPQLGRAESVEADATLGPGETKTLPLDLVAGGAGPGAIDASAHADHGPTAEVRTTVNVGAAAAPAVAAPPPPAPPRLRVEINGLSGAVSVGLPAVYEVKVQNLGDATQSGVRVLAELPEGLEADQADGPTASAVAPHGVVFETLARLGPGESAVYHVRARARRAGVQRLRVEVNADRLPQPASAEASTWVAPGRGY